MKLLTFPVLVAAPRQIEQIVQNVPQTLLINAFQRINLHRVYIRNTIKFAVVKIYLAHKLKKPKALVWPIVTYGSEAWTLNKELCENVEAFEMQCYRRAIRISYVEHMTNEEVLRRVGHDRSLLGQVKLRKLKYFGHTTRHESLEKDIMLGIMPGKRRQGGQKKQWIDDIVHWGERSLVEMVRQAENRKGYRCTA